MEDQILTRQIHRDRNWHSSSLWLGEVGRVTKMF